MEPRVWRAGERLHKHDRRCAGVGGAQWSGRMISAIPLQFHALPREMFLLAEGIPVSLIAFAVAAFFHPVAYHHYFYYVAGLALAAKAASERLVGRSTMRTAGAHRPA